MNIQTSYISVKKTARYTTYGELSEKTQYCWFVLHGSNMQCEQMIYKFKNFDPETHYVVAPEGLSRFYANGFGGDVVAAWMTSRDRIQEIQDFSNYLSQLYTQIADLLPDSCKKIILGFSQGGTTVFRWLHAAKIHYNHIVAYSCWFPEDISLNEAKSKLSQSTILYTYGEQDQYLTEEKMSHVKELVERNGLTVKFLPYSGDHRVDKKQLNKLFDDYIQ